jgi:hypothetical protein
MAKPDLPRVIHLRLEAPPKPELGQPCNGCGVCCAAEPCPLGVLVSRRRHGACRALQWSAALSRYRCGLVSQPTSVLAWLPEWAGPAVAALSRRWISAASGCDAALIVD